MNKQKSVKRGLLKIGILLFQGKKFTKLFNSGGLR